MTARTTMANHQPITVFLQETCKNLQALVKFDRWVEIRRVSSLKSNFEFQDSRGECGLRQETERNENAKLRVQPSVILSPKTLLYPNALPC